MSQSPRISVLMPVRNAEKYLGAAIESVLAQSFGAFELLALYDESIDQSLKVLEHYAAQDNRIRILKNENPKGGLSAALNTGIRASRGQYLARIDADDIALPDRFKWQVDFLEQNQAVIALGTDALTFGVETSRLISFPANHEALVARLKRSTCFAHPTVMLRQKIILENALFYDETMKFCEDWEYWVRLSKFGRLANLNKVALLYRVHPSSVSAENQAKLTDYNRVAVERASKLQIDLGDKTVKEELLISEARYLEAFSHRLIQKILRKVYYRLFGSLYVKYFINHARKT